jgi:hypothetical protein
MALHRAPRCNTLGPAPTVDGAAGWRLDRKVRATVASGWHRPESVPYTCKGYRLSSTCSKMALRAPQCGSQLRVKTTREPGASSWSGSLQRRPASLT